MYTFPSVVLQLGSFQLLLNAARLSALKVCMLHIILDASTASTNKSRSPLVQIKLYRHLLRTKAAASLLSTAVADSSCVLSVITQLKKAGPVQKKNLLASWQC